MNALTQQFSIAVFQCEFCAYRSTLDLRECPECGRVKKTMESLTRRSTGAAKTRSQSGSSIPFGTPYNYEPPPPKNYIFECANCRYLSRNALRECPECGRLKFEKKTAAEEIKIENDFEKNTVETKYKPGYIQLRVGSICLLSALEIFMGVQTDFFGDYVKTAETGEYWMFASVPAIAGIIFVAVGLHLKIKDFTK